LDSSDKGNSQLGAAFSNFQTVSRLFIWFVKIGEVGLAVPDGG